MDRDRVREADGDLRLPDRADELRDVDDLRPDERLVVEPRVDDFRDVDFFRGEEDLLDVEPFRADALREPELFRGGDRRAELLDEEPLPGEEVLRRLFVVLVLREPLRERAPDDDDPPPWLSELSELWSCWEPFWLPGRRSR